MIKEMISYTRRIYASLIPLQKDYILTGLRGCLWTIYTEILPTDMALPHKLQTQGNPLACSPDCLSLWNSIIWVRGKYFSVFRGLNLCVSWAKKTRNECSSNAIAPEMARGLLELSIFT